MRTRDYPSHLELMVLLTVWRLKRDAYGVSIAKEIEERCGYTVSLAGIYSTLERLQDKGMVQSVRGEPTPERGGRARTCFTLTAAGVEEARFGYGALARLAPRGAHS